MRQPWTVRLENLADHAVPLGRAINRWLWAWSPWHRLFQEAEHKARILRRLWDTEEQLQRREHERDQLYDYIKRDRRTLTQLIPPPEVDLVAVPEWGALRLEIRPKRWCYVIAVWDGRLLRSAVEVDYLVERAKEELAVSVAAAYVDDVTAAVKSARERAA